MTKKESKCLYGIAILLMLYHHLFCIPERLGCDYFSVLGINTWGGLTLETRIAWFGKVCIAIYAFLSGFGLNKTYKKNNEHTFKEKMKMHYIKSAKRYLLFMMKVWLVCIVFVPIGYTVHAFRFNGWIDFLKCVFCIEGRINGEWWYVNTYAGMLIILPLLLGFFDKNSKLYQKIMSALIAGCIVVMMREYVNEIYLIIFVEGFICAEYNLFDTIDRYLGKNKFYIVACIIIPIAIRIGIAQNASYREIDIFISSILVYGISRVLRMNIKVNGILEIFGKYSTYMWLVHTFFCYYYFRKFITISGISTVIYVQLIIVSLLASVILMKLEKFVYNIMKNNNHSMLGSVK